MFYNRLFFNSIFNSNIEVKIKLNYFTGLQFKQKNAIGQMFFVSLVCFIYTFIYKKNISLHFFKFIFAQTRYLFFLEIVNSKCAAKPEETLTSVD